MADLKKEAEKLGIDVDGRWSDARIQQEIDKKNGGGSATQADQKAANEARAKADEQARADADRLANAPVSQGDIAQANEDTLPTIGGPRVASTQEIREQQAGEDMEVAPYPADPVEAHARAAALSQPRGPAAEFRTSDLVKGETGEELFAIRLLNDWWDGQGLRHKRGDTIDVPYNEAKRLVGERKAERADNGF